MYYNREFVHQVGKKKRNLYIRMHGQQNIFKKCIPVCQDRVQRWALGNTEMTLALTIFRAI